MSKKRRIFSAEFKTKIVLSLLSEKMSIAQICKKHKLKDGMVSRWKKEFLEKAPEVFESKSGKTNEQSEKIEELEKIIGRLTVEKEILKKTSNFLM